MSCKGFCCAVFTYSSTPDEILERIEGGRAGYDDTILVNMLVPLTFEQARERAEQFGLPTGPQTAEVSRWTESTPLYTCRHWDETTRLCTIYETRPRMCADYPYGKPCGHGCGYCNDDDPTLVDRYITTEIQGGEANAEDS